MKLLYRTLSLLTLLLPLAIPGTEARRTGYQLKVDKSSSASDSDEMTKGSFMVASQCEDCNNGHTLSEISFSGYDKPQSSATETFFITNSTDRTMTGVNLYIEYLTPDGRQLTKRFLRLTCNIPPGERRMAEVKSWDKQKSFHYAGSAASRKGGSPYVVVFDPVAYYLRF